MIIINAMKKAMYFMPAKIVNHVVFLLDRDAVNMLKISKIVPLTPNSESLIPNT